MLIQDALMLGGWLEISLSPNEILKLYTFIEDSKKSNVNVKNNLVGNITSSLKLIDTDNWFFENICINLINLYSHYFPRLNLLTQNSKDHPLSLGDFWVNFQNKQNLIPYIIIVVFFLLLFGYRFQHHLKSNTKLSL